jgi:hypothetical protein
MKSIISESFPRQDNFLPGWFDCFDYRQNNCKVVELLVQCAKQWVYQQLQGFINGKE